MTLSTRILLGLSGLALIASVAVVVVQELILKPGFEKLERETTARNLSRVAQAIDQDLKALSHFCHDWAAWDDTLQFMASGSREFLDVNLPPQTFANGNFDIAFFVAPDGRVVFGEARDPARNGEPRPVACLPSAAIPLNDPLLASHDIDTPVNGLRQCGTDLLLLSSWPITDSAQQSPLAGWLVMGRYFNDARHADLSGRTRVSFEVQDAGLAQGHEDLAALARLRSGEQDVQLARDGRDRQAWMLLKGVDPGQRMLLGIAWPRDITRQGSSVMAFALASLVAAFVLTLGAVGLLIQRAVIRPLAKLTERVVRVRSTREGPAAAGDRRRDELVVLTREFDAMLARQDRSRDELERLVEVRTHDLRLATERAMAADRAKSEFLANMSHELRTPLTSMLGYADLLRESPLPPEEVRENARVIHRNGEHLLALLDDVLELARLEAGRIVVQLAECSPAALAREVGDEFRPAAERKGLSLDVVLRLPLPDVIRSDAVRLRRMLAQLTANAVQFTDRGSVILHVRLVGSPEVAESQIEFAVTDTGIGLSTEQLARLFLPFEQADTSSTRRCGGMGVGLNLVHRLAYLIGGELGVRSEKSVGSTFTLRVAASAPAGTLPSARDPSTVAPISPACGETRRAPDRFLLAAAVPAPRLSGRILLAEDTRDSALLISTILRRAGAEVVVVGDGQKAVEAALAAASAGPPFALILMDLHMPVMDGLEATRTLRAAGYYGMISALTADAMPSDREACLVAGCDEHATKPVQRKELLSLCARLMPLTGAPRAPTLPVSSGTEAP